MSRVPMKFALRSFVQERLFALINLYDFIAMHPMRAMHRVALDQTVDFLSQNMMGAIALRSGRRVMEFALSNVGVDGHYVEFGVGKGVSTGFLAKAIGGKTLHGFDSFEGLPEDWVGHNEAVGAFSTGGKLPRLPRNVRLHVGWFDDSLARWLQEHDGPVAFIHIDCDLYSSTKVVFEQLSDRIVPGTVIVFDEYFNYPNWQEHEHKAFQEFVKKYKCHYTYLAYGRYQAVAKVLGHDDGAPSG